MLRHAIWRERRGCKNIEPREKGRGEKDDVITPRVKRNVQHMKNAYRDGRMGAGLDVSYLLRRESNRTVQMRSSGKSQYNAAGKDVGRGLFDAKPSWVGFCFPCLDVHFLARDTRYVTDGCLFFYGARPSGVESCVLLVMEVGEVRGAESAIFRPSGKGRGIRA